MNYQTIECVKNEAVATVWLNRPEVRNAFNEIMIAEMTQVFNALHEDEQVRVASSKRHSILCRCRFKLDEKNVCL